MIDVMAVKNASCKGRNCTRHGKAINPSPASGAIISVNGVLFESKPPEHQAMQDFTNKVISEIVNSSTGGEYLLKWKHHDGSGGGTFNFTFSENEKNKLNYILDTLFPLREIKWEFVLLK